MEIVRRYRGWNPGSVEHAVIRIVPEGLELEGVVLGGSPEQPYAVRYAVIAHPDGRCRGVTLRAIGEPILVDMLSGPDGRWIDSGTEVRELDGITDVDLGISPATIALSLFRLGLRTGESASVPVIAVDVSDARISRSERRIRRAADDRWHIYSVQTGEPIAVRWDFASWSIEVVRDAPAAPDRP